MSLTAVSFITHVTAVIIAVTLPLGWDATAIVTLELVGTTVLYCQQKTTTFIYEHVVA